MKPIPHQLTPKVKLLHKVVIFRKYEFLLLKRNDTAKYRPSAWDLPGGNSEWPTNLPSGFDYHLHDVVRELTEETTIKLSTKELGKDNLIYFRTYFDSQLDIYTLICGWQYHLKNKPAIQLSREHSSYAWVTKKQLDKYDFGGSTGNFILDIIKNTHN